MEKEKPARFQFRLRTLLIGIVMINLLFWAFFTFLRPLLESNSGPKPIVWSSNIIRQLVVSMQNFRMDYNQYPWPDDAPPMGTSIADILRELAPTDPRVTKGKKPTINTAMRTYFEYSDRYFRNGTLVDYWGNEYMIVYEFSVKGRTMWGRGPNGDRIEYEVKVPIIWSKGPNGIDETSDSDEDYGDDIANARQKR